MASPIRACCLCFLRAVQVVNRTERPRHILFRLNYDTSLIRHLGSGQRLLAKHSDNPQGDQLADIPIVNTKAEVRFHVQTADWVSEEVKKEILLKNKSRINKAGELIVTSEVSRSQQRNLEDCVQKISEIIRESSQRPPEPSADDLALRAKRLEKRNLTRLKQKKSHSSIKQARQVNFD